MFIYSFRCQKICVYVMITAVIIVVMEQTLNIVDFPVFCFSYPTLTMLHHYFLIQCWLWCLLLLFSQSHTSHILLSSIQHCQITRALLVRDSQTRSSVIFWLFLIFYSQVVCSVIGFFICSIYSAWVRCMKPSSGNRLNLQEAGSGELSGVWHCYELS
jgi:hypothetical protein